MGDDSWRTEARCQGMDTNWFFPNEKNLKRIRAAKAFCRGCSVRLQCIQFAIEYSCEGIYGGATTAERSLMSALLPRASRPVYTSESNDTPECVPVTHIVSRTHIAIVEQLPFVLDLHALQGGEVDLEFHTLSHEADVVVQVGFGPSTSFILRMA